MYISEIYTLLDSLSPFSLQASWDNSGLNIGTMGQKVDSIALALELDSTMAQHFRAKHLANHPPPAHILPVLKSLDTATYPANLIATLMQKNCALIAMHTNFDLTHLNAHFAREILGFATTEQGIAQHCQIAPTPLLELAKSCKKALSLEHIRFVQAEQNIEHIYIVCGFWGKLR